MPDISPLGLVIPYGDVDLWSTLAEVMACCPTAPSHYRNQCWLFVTEVLGIDLRAISQENIQDIYPCMYLRITNLKV